MPNSFSDPIFEFMNHSYAHYPVTHDRLEQTLGILAKQAQNSSTSTCQMAQQAISNLNYAIGFLMAQTIPDQKLFVDWLDWELTHLGESFLKSKNVAFTGAKDAARLGLSYLTLEQITEIEKDYKLTQKV